MKVKTIVYLEKVPFDRWDGSQFNHATGRELILEDGTSRIEYEDEIDFYDYAEANEVEECDYYA